MAWVYPSSMGIINTMPTVKKVGIWSGREHSTPLISKLAPKMFNTILIFTDMRINSKFL